MILKLRGLTIAGDYLILLSAFVLAYFLRVGFIFSSDLPFLSYTFTALITAVVWISALIVFRGYNLSVRLNRPVQLLKILIAGITGTAAFALIFYFFEKTLFSRLLVVYMFCLGSFSVVCFHLLMQMIEYRLIRSGYGTVRLLIIGSNRGVKAFIAKLKQNISRYLPVAVLDGHGTSQKELEGVPVMGKLNILESTVQKYKIDAIVQGDNIEQVINIQSFCKHHGLDYYLLPYLFGAYQGQLQVSWLETPVITTHKPSPYAFWEKIIGS